MKQKKKKNSRADIQSATEKEQEVKDFREWLEKSEQESLFKKVDWDYYENREDWITDFQNWNRLQPKRIELLKKWLNND